jgi:hypothetical protein
VDGLRAGLVRLRHSRCFPLHGRVPPRSLELAISPSGPGSVASQQSGWDVEEFQTAPEAYSGLHSRREFPTVDPLADESGTFPWIRKDLVASLL